MKPDHEETAPQGETPGQRLCREIQIVIQNAEAQGWGKLHPGLGVRALKDWVKNVEAWYGEIFTREAARDRLTQSNAFEIAVLKEKVRCLEERETARAIIDEADGLRSVAGYEQAQGTPVSQAGAASIEQDRHRTVEEITAEARKNSGKKTQNQDGDLAGDA